MYPESGGSQKRHGNRLPFRGNRVKSGDIVDAQRVCAEMENIMILLIDNYDSFSYNVYQLTASVCPDVKVIRNDAMTVEEIEALSPSHIILSP